MNFIVFKGSIETLEFFSKQISNELVERGHTVFFFDLSNDLFSMKNLVSFCNMSDASPILITFNHMGLSDETIFLDKNGASFFDEFNIPCVNIIVDHPLYYHQVMKNIPKKYVQICIDEEHTQDMKRFYPNVAVADTMYLAGTSIKEPLLPISERKYDISFCGNYTPPEKFIKHFDRLSAEYRDFYMSILETMKLNPSITLTKALSDAIYKSLGPVSDKDLDEAMANMIYADLYTRFYFRGEVIKSLSDYDLKVHVFGKGWEDLKCLHPKNIISHGSVKTYECLRAASNSKLSINVMPWFKNSCHDRVFSCIMNESVLVTDHSDFIDNYFVDDSNIILYGLDNIKLLPKRLSELLSDEARLQDIATKGFNLCRTTQNWSVRTDYILFVINKFFNT